MLDFIYMGLVDTYMYFLYMGISSKYDEVERILSCTCTALCKICEYIYIGQIAKIRRSPAFAFNMQNTTKHST